MDLSIQTHHPMQAIKGLEIVFLLILLTFLLSCSRAPTTSGNKQRTIDPTAAVSLLEKKDAVAIDTMSYIECMDHRIPGSHCMPLEEIDKKLPSFLTDKKQPIIFYCESDRCPRAGLAYERARLLGYENMYVLESGLSAWKRAGQEVERTKRIKRVPVIAIKASKLQDYLREKKDLFVLDIRSEDIFKANHIVGAVNIPFYMLHKRLNEIPRNRPVIVIDDDGKRSYLACSYIINNNGNKDVVRLFRGMGSIAPKNGNKGGT